MSRDPLDAFRAADTAVPIPGDVDARIQQRMFEAWETAHASDPTAEDLEEHGEVPATGIDVTVIPIRASSWWARHGLQVAVAASVMVILGIALFVTRNGDRSEVDTASTVALDDPEVAGQSPAQPLNDEEVDAVCSRYVSGLEQWNPPLGSIDEGQVGPAITYLRAMIDDLTAALDTLESASPAIESVRNEVASIDAQFSREEANPTGARSIHVLPLVARRLGAVAGELSDLGIDSCAPASASENVDLEDDEPEAQ